MRSCAKLPPSRGAIAGFFFNTRRWPGRAADFHCARRAFSMFFGNAAPARASFFMTSCRCAARESSAAIREVLPAARFAPALCAFGTGRLHGSVDKITWLPTRREKASFIPVGANCPETASRRSRRRCLRSKTVAVYSITGGDRTSIEVADIGAALKQGRIRSWGRFACSCLAAVPGRPNPLCDPSWRARTWKSNLWDFFRPTKSAGALARSRCAAVCARADFEPARKRDRRHRLRFADRVLLGPRNCVAHHGSGNSGRVPLGDREALAAALENVLSDAAFRKTLAERSRQAQEKYFSWAAITGRFAEELHLRDKDSAAEPRGGNRCNRANLKQGGCSTK